MIIDNEEYVKAFFPGESMWVKVLSRINENAIIGILENTPAYQQIKAAIEAGEDIDPFYMAVYQKGALLNLNKGDKVLLELKQIREDLPSNWTFKEVVN